MGLGLGFRVACSILRPERKMARPMAPEAHSPAPPWVRVRVRVRVWVRLRIIPGLPGIPTRGRLPPSVFARCSSSVASHCHGSGEDRR